MIGQGLFPRQPECGRWVSSDIALDFHFPGKAITKYGESYNFDTEVVTTRNSVTNVLTRAGTFTGFAIDTPAVTDKGLSIEASVTNKCTNYNANPTDLTGVSKSGDVASTLSVVSDANAIQSGGLSQICSTGMVYKLDNSAGTSAAFFIVSGETGNTDQHTVSCFARLETGSSRLEFSAVGSSPATDFNGSSYVRYENSTPISFNSSSRLQVRAEAGAVVYLILNQLELGPVATSPIITTGSAATRSHDRIVTDISDIDFSQGVYGRWTGEFKDDGENYRRLLAFHDGSSSNRSILVHSNGLNMESYKNGVGGGSSVGSWNNGEREIVFGFGPSFAQGILDGSANAVDTTPDRYNGAAFKTLALGTSSSGADSHTSNALHQTLTLYAGTPTTEKLQALVTS